MHEVNRTNWLTELETYKDAFIQDLRGLIAVPSVRDDETKTANAPFGADCRKALDCMLELGKREGFQIKDYDGYAGVIAYGEGEGSIGVLVHLGIMSIGEGWSRDPFGGDIVNGYMFGRGILDDKGSAMAGFYVLKMLRGKGIKLNRKVMLILGCDEESGMECMDYYTKHGELPTLGFTSDADFPVIYEEKGGLYVKLSGTCGTVIISMHAGECSNIVIGQVSAQVRDWKEEYLDAFLYHLRVFDLKGSVETLDNESAVLHMEGVFVHAAMPYSGVNVALHLLNFIGYTYGDKFACDTCTTLKDWQGKPLGIDIDGAYMGFLVMNTGIVNTEHNEASIVIDIHYPNDVDPKRITEGFTDMAKRPGYALDVTLKKNTKSLFMDPDSKLVQTSSSVHRDYTHDTFTPNMTIGGGIYAKKLDNFVAFGPELPNREQPKDMFIGGRHQKDEAIRVEDSLRAVAIYTAAIEQLVK